jgi:hypothetical protein
MMTHSDKHTDFDLDAILSDARMAVPTPDDAFFRAILSDAQSVLDDVMSEPVQAAIPWWRQLWADLGGWPTVTGLATAAVVGIWIGLSADTLFPQNATSFDADSELSDPFSGLDLAMLEG